MERHLLELDVRPSAKTVEQVATPRSLSQTAT
jgi:hypothetical protein